MSTAVRCLSRLENLRCSGLTLPQMIDVNVTAVVELGAIAYLLIIRAKGTPLTWSAYLLMAEIIATMALTIVYFGFIFVASRDKVGLLEVSDEVITFLSPLPLFLLLLLSLLPSLSDIDSLPWTDGTAQEMMTKAMAYLHVAVGIVTGLAGVAMGVLGGFLGVAYDTDVPSVSMDGIATIGSSYANLDEWLMRSASITSCVAVAVAVIPIIPRHLFSSPELQTYLDRYSTRNTGDLRPLLDLIALILGLLVAAGELLMGVLRETFAILLVRRCLRAVARVLMAIGLAAVSRKAIPPGPRGHDHDSWAIIEGPEVAATTAVHDDAKSSVASWVTGRRGRNRSNTSTENMGVISAAEMTASIKHSYTPPSLKLNARAVEPLNIPPPPMAQFEHPALTAPRPGYHYQVRRFSGGGLYEDVQHDHGSIVPPSPRVRPDLAVIQRPGGSSARRSFHQRFSSFSSSWRRTRASDASQYSQQSLGGNSHFLPSTMSIPRSRNINSVLNSIYEGIEYKEAGGQPSYIPYNNKGGQVIQQKAKSTGPEEDGRRNRLLQNIAHMQADPYDDEGEEVILGDRRDSPTIKSARRPRESLPTSTWSSSVYTEDPRGNGDGRGYDKPTYRDERVLSSMNRIPRI